MPTNTRPTNTRKSRPKKHDDRSTDTPPWCLDWTIDIVRLEDGPVEVTRTADSAQLLALTSALSLLSVDALTATATVRPRGPNRVILDGRLTATIRQACVVTLDPVTQMIDEPLTIELWPADQIAPETRSEVEVSEADVPEPLDGTLVPFGRLVYETLAAAIDPYPRADGAALEVPERPADTPPNPFAALARLKDRKPGNID